MYFVAVIPVHYSLEVVSNTGELISHVDKPSNSSKFPTNSTINAAVWRAQANSSLHVAGMISSLQGTEEQGYSARAKQTLDVVQAQVLVEGQHETT